MVWRGSRETQERYRMTKLTLSDHMTKELKRIAEEAGKELFESLQIAEYDSIRLSLHVAPDTTGRMMG